MTDTNNPNTMSNQTSIFMEQPDTGNSVVDCPDLIIKKLFLRPEHVVLISEVSSKPLIIAVASQVRKVYLLLHPDAKPSLMDDIAGLKNVELLVTGEGELQIPEESMDVVIAAIPADRKNVLLQYIKSLSAMLRPAGRLVTLLNELLTPPWKLEDDQMKNLLRKAGLVNTIVMNEPSFESTLVGFGTKKVEGARSSVRKHYQSLAEGSSCCEDSGSSCCGASSSCCCGSDEMDSAITFNTGYSIEDIQPLPEESTNLTLGCGNPIARANLQPGECVLDIGSGAGTDVLLAARVVGEQGFVVGVDMTPAMLERALLSAQKNNVTNVEFKSGHAESLPLDNNSFDVVISNCVINLCEDKGKVFEEIFRVLRSGGRMVISDIVTDEDLPLEARLEAAGWTGCISGALPHPEYIDLMLGAGFVVDDIQQGISGGIMGDTQVYSLEIIARKP